MNKIALVSLHKSIITLNINGFYAPIKKHRVLGWIKTRPNLMLPTRNLTPALKTHKDSK